MRFEDLPKDWSQRPVTDPDIFEGVIDLIASDRSRADGAIHVLLCHPSGRLMQPICLSDGGWSSTPVDVLEALCDLFSTLSGMGVAHVVLAIARPGSTKVTRQDLDVRAAFEGACRTNGFELLAVAIAATEGVVALPAEDPAQVA